MRTIIAPLYIRPVKVTKEKELLITGADKYIEHRNIMTWKSDKFSKMLSYLLDDEISLHDEKIFYRLVEEIGYMPFLEIASLDGFDEMTLRFEQPDEVPSFILDSLFETARPHLEEFRPQLQGLIRAKSKNRIELENLILECWRKASAYGFTHHFTCDHNRVLVHIMEGRDIRAGALIGIALYLEKRGELPQPPRVKYCRYCGSPINPLIYPGRYYCSDAHRRSSARNDRSRLVNLIQTKSRRMVARGQLTEKKRETMLRKIGGEKSLKKIREIARGYGVDPTPAKAGRKAKDGQHS